MKKLEEEIKRLNKIIEIQAETIRSLSERVTQYYYYYPPAYIYSSGNITTPPYTWNMQTSSGNITTPSFTTTSGFCQTSETNK